MAAHFAVHPWKLIQTSFHREDQRFAESLMSLGNGSMGLRGNFEERYSADSLQGTYIGGVWFPDKTRVGWWKNGYPRYFGKAINTMNLIGLDVEVNGETLDTGVMEVLEFSRELEMKAGLLRREMRLKTRCGSVRITSERFVSMDNKTLLALRYQVRPDYPARVEIKAFLDGNVRNEDSNYEEHFWNQLHAEASPADSGGLVVSQTRENPFGTPRFTVAGAFRVLSNMTVFGSESREGYAALILRTQVAAGESTQLEKLVCVRTDRDEAADGLAETVRCLAAQAAAHGYERLREEHMVAWARKWETADVEILGDEAAQQGIRFNLFHLLSTYTGEDSQLNIGPKGFTGEKYGGATYWDTEAFCFPVYLAIAGSDVARNLLLYRYKQLPGAYHNARQQGLPGALFPMVTFNGIECHNEWEITFMELHRNGAITHAVFDYVTYTGDEEYLVQEGLDVLCGIARFWAGRVHKNARTGQYMIHGVTGPNEYENNVNNNWYTNRIAAWCLDYFVQACSKAPKHRLDELHVSKEDLALMQSISGNIYYPFDEERGVFVQHDTFLDKVLMPASALDVADRPINHKWSWDRILRSCFIKQADVLQGLYFLGHLYDRETKKRNFDFYEPMTVHESSLSPCIHSVIAAEIGYEGKAVELYRRTARLDLDNINHDTGDGLHITSMSGAWLAIVQGFAGMRTVSGLSFSPFLPSEWQGFSFRFDYRNRVIRFEMAERFLKLRLLAGEPLPVTLWGKVYMLDDTLEIRKVNL
jgi:maltose phosphorylase